jgi:predicted O-linked N-acetylglucosamine transferase (SPINDLY family)
LTDEARELCALAALARLDGRLDEAADAYRRALAAAPGWPVPRAGLAATLTDLGTEEKLAGRLDAGVRRYEEALAVEPTHAGALYNLGVAFMDSGRRERAARAFDLAVRSHPSHADALNNLGVLHRDAGRDDRAAECYLAALAARPRFPEALNNLGVIRIDDGLAAQALRLFDAALAARPEYPQAHCNRGVALLDLGLADEAFASYGRCLALGPDDRDAGHNRLYACNYLWPGDDPTVVRAHRAWGRRFAARFPALPPLAPEEVRRRAADGDRPLVVGYLSPDLRTHSVSYFAEAPLRHHDPARVRVVVYSCVARPDDRTASLRRTVEDRGHAWRDVAGLDEDELARLARADAVDILVELSGHTAGNRLGAVAMRPAPVQLSWIGYPNVTGLDAVDYRLTDARCDPPGPAGRPRADGEELVRLPGCFLAYAPPPDAPEVTPLPALAGGHVTFGSFNHLAKITPEVMRLWARLLDAVPGSRLLLKGRPLRCADGRRLLLARLAAAGIAPERVGLLPRNPSAHDHLASYAAIDISLDPWPYGGTTTTCESLLMGVPCITLRGPGHAHNVGHSLLAAVGLDDWVADEPEAYVDLAARAAADLDGLAAIRRALRPRLLASPLCDGATFTARLEETYRALWARWRA